MKRKLLILIFAAVLWSVASQAKDVRSPDGQFAVRTEKAITLVDAGGNEILTLVKDTTGDQKIEVAWSPDSRHVLIVEGGARDSAIVGAWRDEAWHKTIDMDAWQEGIGRKHSDQRNRMAAEHRKLAGWLTPSEAAVQGEMLFRDGTKLHYSYILAFQPVPGHLDRGGYEEGQLIGKDYRGL